MPDASLNQWSGALPGLGSSAKGFSRLRFLSVSPVLQFNLLAFTTSAVRTRASFFWCSVLSFYRLEQAPNTVIYAMSKNGQQRAV